jgi:hypothetical protein
MKSLIVCFAFFAIALGFSNVTMAECDTPVRDRVSCLGCKAKGVVKRVSRSAMCRVQSVKCKVVKAVKSAPCRVRRGVNKVMNARPKMMRCCESQTVTTGVATIPVALIIPVAIMPAANELLIIKQ